MPLEIARTEAAFWELIGEVGGEEKSWREQARVIFLAVTDTGARRAEACGLHWREVHLADPAGPRIRVRNTWLLGGVDTPKSRAGFRTIELSPSVADELFEHRGRTSYSGDDDFVFSSTKGTPIDVARYAKTLRLALARAKIEGYVRPFQDWRHTSLTLGAGAGEIPAALQRRAGHSSYRTTQGYVHLAGVEFPEETRKRSERLWTGTKNRYKVEPEADAVEVDIPTDSAQRSGTGVEPA